VVACCNASQYGNNAYIAPKASITDGLLDIIIIHQGSPIDTAMVGMDLFTGYIDSNTLIHSLRAPAAVIYRPNEGPAHIDGEPMILDDIMDIKCHRHGLNIFIPGDKEQFRPLVTPVRSLWRNIFSLR
jgi:diacylglycerol kinase family enzyme